MKALSTIFYITLVFLQSMKSDLEALYQTKDNILEAKATENQQQAEIIQQLEVQFMHACMYVTALCNNVTLQEYPVF